MHAYFEDSDRRQDREIVLQKDERKRVRDTSRPPFRWICSLEVEFAEPVLYPLGTLEHPGKSWKDIEPGRKGCGSGLLISPKHVLTAAHVLAGLKVVQAGGAARFELVPAKKVTVIPGRNAESGSNPMPFGAYDSQQVLISPGFRSAMEVPVAQLTKARVRKALASDFGVIEVKEKTAHGRNSPVVPGQTAGWWGEFPEYKLQAVDDAFRRRLQKAKVHIAGYPGEKAKVACSVPWHAFDKVIDAFPKARGQPENLLFYQADTSAGMSGSPVWFKDENGVCFLVGVHSSFLEDGGRAAVNVGCLVSQYLSDQILNWAIGNLQVIIFIR